MTIEEQIEVMTHFKNGGEVEYSTRGTAMEEFCGDILDENEWSPAANPTWDWKDKLYRIKPEPQKPEDRIEAEYPEFDVIPLEWSGNKLKFEASINRHFEAQSMKGFAGYVYDDLELSTYPTQGEWTDEGMIVKMPIAVLFTKDSNEEA